MTTVATSEVLNRAADLIEERGWVSGEIGWPGYQGGDGRLCLEGGVMAALGMTWGGDALTDLWTCPAYAAVQAHLGLAVSLNKVAMPADPLWRWNDDYRRTASEVIEVLRAVAVIEAAREQASVEVTA